MEDKEKKTDEEETTNDMVKKTQRKETEATEKKVLHPPVWMFLYRSNALCFPLWLRLLP